jgi:hypothetical protein
MDVFQILRPEATNAYVARAACWSALTMAHACVQGVSMLAQTPVWTVTRAAGVLAGATLALALLHRAAVARS